MMHALLDFARELGREAGRQLLAWHGRAHAGVKSDGSVVTEADQAVDSFLSREIRARYPDHGILSEEADTLYAGQPYTWVIDPLDGTTNFALGVCYWGCSIGIVHRGLPLLGVLVFPNLEAEYWAIQGGGAYLNGERLGGPARSISEKNAFVALCSRSWRHLELPIVQKGRLLGSAAYDMVAVAQGIAVAFTEVTPHIWDLAAGWLLVKEAGRVIGPLLPGAPDPFPMLPGTDYRDRVFPLAGASDKEMLHKLLERVTIKAASRQRVEAWAAAGWRT